MINKNTGSQLSPWLPARIALQIPLPGGTTHPGYLYCTANVHNPDEISNTLNNSYYCPDLIRCTIACRSHSRPLQTFFQNSFIIYYPNEPSSPDSTSCCVQL